MITLKLLYILICFLCILIVFIFIVLWSSDGKCGVVSSKTYKTSDLYVEDENLDLIQILKIRLYTDMPNLKFKEEIINKSCNKKIYISEQNFFKLRRNSSVVKLTNANIETLGNYLFEIFRQEFYLHALKIITKKEKVFVKRI